MRFDRTTGLSTEQLRHLVERVHERINTRTTGGVGSRSLGLFRAVALAVAYLRQNITQVVLAEYFGVSQSTVSRVICHLTPVLADVLDEFIPNAHEATEGRVVLVDGTLAPCWSWAGHRELYSGKHHTTGHNIQVLSDLEGNILYITRAFPGSMHDIEAFRQSGLDQVIDLVNTIGDKGYIGLGVQTPTRKPAGGELVGHQVDTNTTINSLRAAVERAIAHIKTWKILHTDYRRPLKTFESTLDAVVGLICFRCL